MKRSILLGMLALALPSAGCSTLSDSRGSGTGLSTAKQAQVPSKPVFGSGPEVTIFLKQAQDARSAGDMNTAAKILTQLVLVAPSDPRVIGEYGKVLVAEGRSNDALAFLDSAIRLQPGDWTLYSAQGVAYDEQSNYLTAQASYARALELKPGEPAVLNNDGLSHIKAGDLAGAENLLRQVSNESPDYAQIAESLALLEKLKANAAPAHRITAVENQMPAPVATPTLVMSKVVAKDVVRIAGQAPVLPTASQQ